MDNGQSRSIVGHDEIIAEHYGGELDFRRIFDSLPRFLFIGLQDKLQESVNKICERIGIKDVPEHVSFKYGPIFSDTTSQLYHNFLIVKSKVVDSTKSASHIRREQYRTDSSFRFPGGLRQKHVFCFHL